MRTSADRVEKEWKDTLKLRSFFDIQIDAVTKLVTTHTHLVARYLAGNDGTKQSILNYCLCLLQQPQLQIADFDDDIDLKMFDADDLQSINEYLEKPHETFQEKFEEIQTLQFCMRDRRIFFPERKIRRALICSGAPTAPHADEPQDLQRKIRLMMTKSIVIHGVRVFGTVECCAIDMALNMRRLGDIYTSNNFEPFTYYVMKSCGRAAATFEILMDKPFVANCNDVVDIELLTDLPLFRSGLDYKCGGSKSFRLKRDGEGKTVFVEIIYSPKPKPTVPPVCYL